MNLTIKAYRYRIYPNDLQLAEFIRISGACRFLYNLALDQRQMFGRKGRNISYRLQNKELTSLKWTSGAEWLKLVPSQCLQEALRNLDIAYQRFFKGLADYPTYRKKFEHDSFTFPQGGELIAEYLVLPKFGKTKKDHGSVKIVIHRPIKGKIKNVTISRDGEAWYASLQVEIKSYRPVRPNGRPPVGVDRGVKSPVATSAGDLLGRQIETVRMREREKRLRRDISRKKKGSANRRKALAALRRHKAKMARRRVNEIHKITTWLAKNHGLVVIEDLKVQNMTASARGTVDQPGSNVAQKSGLNREILDKSWGEYRRQLLYKCAWYGSILLEVLAHYTSQTCSACGCVDSKSRQSQALFLCCHCGHAEHADINAAKEIQRRGIEIGKAQGIWASACGDFRATWSMKQETKFSSSSVLANV